MVLLHKLICLQKTCKRKYYDFATIDAKGTIAGTIKEQLSERAAFVLGIEMVLFLMKIIWIN